MGKFDRLHSTTTLVPHQRLTCLFQKYCVLLLGLHNYDVVSLGRSIPEIITTGRSDRSVLANDHGFPLLLSPTSRLSTTSQSWRATPLIVLFRSNGSGLEEVETRCGATVRANYFTTGFRPAQIIGPRSGDDISNCEVGAQSTR